MNISNDLFIIESSVASYSRSFPAVFDMARGAEMFDASGRSWIDFLAGAGALSYGHNNPVLKASLLKYISDDGISMGLDLHTRAKGDFLETLQELILAPRGLDYVVQFTGPTGANAVEAAIKLARKATGRANVLFFTNGFHGVSMGALSVTGNSYNRGGAGVPLTLSHPMPYDGYLGPDVDTLTILQKMLEDPSSGLDMPAAVIVECVQGEGGLNVARPVWLRGLSRLCRRHGIVLIADDIQAGCGRTGDFFSFEAADIVPDMVTLSKSLSGYGLPLSIVLIRPDLDVWKPGEHNGTFRGNNLAFVTASEMLRHYWTDGTFSRDVHGKADLLRDRLRAMAKRHSDVVSGVKGRGMMQGLAMSCPDLAAQVTRRAFENGLIIERAGPRDEVIKVLAPLVTPPGQLEAGLDIIETSLSEAVAAEAGNSDVTAA